MLGFFFDTIREKDREWEEERNRKSSSKKEVPRLLVVEPNNSQQLSVTIPKKYRPSVDKMFDMIAECMDWNEFERESKIITSIVDCNNCNNSKTWTCDNNSRILLCQKFFDDFANNPRNKQNIINGSQILLHEFYHRKLRNAGVPRGGLKEERSCDKFADDCLKSQGYKRTHTTIYD